MVSVCYDLEMKIILLIIGYSATSRPDRSTTDTEGESMFKRTGHALFLGILTLALLPEAGVCGNSGYHGRPGTYYGSYHGSANYYHGHHDNGDAWVWGVGGLLLGSALTAATLRYPPPPQNVYVAPPPPQVVYVQPQMQVYKPAIPPGQCRWERVVLDSYGRTVMDQYGQPLLQYTIGPCQYPPN